MAKQTYQDLIAESNGDPRIAYITINRVRYAVLHDQMSATAVKLSKFERIIGKSPVGDYKNPESEDYWETQLCDLLGEDPVNRTHEEEIANS